MTLLEALPDFVSDIESALIRIGRGDIAGQLREVELERWTYAEVDDAGYLYLRSPRPLNIVDRNIIGVKHGETVCALEDLTINLDVDNHGRLKGIELLDAKSIISQLEKNIAV